MEGIIKLYKKYKGSSPLEIQEIPRAVSTRRYFRIFEDNASIIACYSPDIKETIAFTSYARHFYKKGINVPELYALSDDLHFYLQQDLGNTALHDIIVSRESASLNTESMKMYEAAIHQLVKIQVEGHKGLDYSVAVPREAFDIQSILWDLNHFKYYFLKPSGLAFDEQKLEDDFTRLATIISKMEMNSFMFRDFQTRNIMMHNNSPFLIDFQGGRKGPLQYDLASLVFEAKTALQEVDRDALIATYLKELSVSKSLDNKQFMNDFWLVALIRILQVLGTYGLRGNMEKKIVFLQSIRGGLENLSYLLKKLENSACPVYLLDVLQDLAGTKQNYPGALEAYQGLTVSVGSFSYKKPLPDDLSGNGGGFMYDCRFMENPGRHEEYRSQTGLDAPVKEFLEARGEMAVFLEGVRKQIKTVIEVYEEREFRHLSISFGCTGGQHRSVYAARAIADWLRGMNELRVIEVHRELGLTF